MHDESPVRGNPGLVCDDPEQTVADKEADGEGENSPLETSTPFRYLRSPKGVDGSRR